jgi:acetyltransferase
MLAILPGRRRKLEKEEIFGMGRLSKVHGINRAEFAIILSDGVQGQTGTHLLSLLVDIGRQEGLKGIFGHILRDNYGMQRVAKKVGFTVEF